MKPITVFCSVIYTVLTILPYVLGVIILMTIVGHGKHVMIIPSFVFTVLFTPSFVVLNISVGRTGETNGVMHCVEVFAFGGPAVFWILDLASEFNVLVLCYGLSLVLQFMFGIWFRDHLYKNRTRGTIYEPIAGVGVPPYV